FLVERVQRGVAAGQADPVVLVVRERTLDAIDLGEIRATGLPLAWFVAGLTTSSTTAGGEALAVGVSGRLTRRRTGTEALETCATVFLEWEDGRWWQWAAALDDGGSMDPATVEVRGAEAGDPLPEGLGRWWSTGRRHGVSLGLRALAPDPTGGMEQ
ncbi:MAG: hypothetical protein KC656_31180, partial [Myxococcales bacterium]|nr:hypothetical protein [Myxococcales bacterium]